MSLFMNINDLRAYLNFYYGEGENYQTILFHFYPSIP